MFYCIIGTNICLTACSKTFQFVYVHLFTCNSREVFDVGSFNDQK